ncbi:MAG: hypothetical protein QNJ98_14860 [Planctomycetota bacterium]|nr:hypothetical protein [Planctomycetota bacterium]
MESGPLSAADFPEFAKKVVPFLHVTTRIADRKYDSLLQEKGFRGFPSLAFMDAEGNILAQPQGRSVESFDKTLTALERYDDLQKRIDGGEEGLEADMLLVEHALGKVNAQDFESRAGALEKVTDEQKAEIDQILVNNEISMLSMKSRQGEAGLKEAAEGMLKMLEAGKRPSKEVGYAAPFWMTLGRYGQQSLDASLMRKAAEGMKADLPGEARALEIAKDYEETAGKIDSHADLKKRADGGEAGLDASILLLEYELGAVEGPAFKERATPLLETAKAEEKEKLETALVEIRFNDIISGARGSQQAMQAAGETLAKLMKDEGMEPPASVARQAWGLLAGYAQRSMDPDLMDFAADGIIKAYAGNPNAANYANKMKADAAKLREEKAKAEAEAEKGDDDAPAEPDKEDGDG